MARGEDREGVPNPLGVVVGKVFQHPRTQRSYGPIRLAGQKQFSTLDGTLYDALAEDSCGNFFTKTIDGAVCVWDHETDQLIRLADSLPDFLAGCVEPEPVELDPKRVKSVWIDPQFARSMGKKVPEDGWVKKPK
jgi:hypothetical protein